MKYAAQFLLIASLSTSWTLSTPAWAASSLVPEQECTEANSYLEPYLARKADPGYCATCGPDSANKNPAAVADLADSSGSAANKVTFPQGMAQPLPEACFIESMKMRPHGASYHYATCETNQSKVKDRPRHLPPCITESLVKPMQSALAETMNCLGVDQREVFSLFGWESHYQVNLHNPGGIGIGQLTSIAVADTDLRSHFKGDESKPQCKQFGAIFEQSDKNRATIVANHGRYKSTNPCEWLAQPDNPARNLLYAGAVYRDDKTLAEKLAQKIGATPAETARIAIELARYMYSMAGPGTISKLFKLWELRDHPGRLTFKAFYKEFPAFLTAHDEAINPKTGDPMKIVDAKYTKNIDNHTRSVEKAVGGKQCAE